MSAQHRGGKYINAKKIFEFTLVLKNADENTPDLEDSLYEAGCDDALINFRNGAVYLDFDREAISLEEAVISAIKSVKSASVDAEVARVAPENLVTESEIAKRLNKNRQTISLWTKGARRKLFPHPVMRLAEKSPLWNWSEVVSWLYKNKIIDNRELVDRATFFSNINAALEECDIKTREMRHNLLEKIASL
jgi:hypothetical protein